MEAWQHEATLCAESTRPTERTADSAELKPVRRPNRTSCRLLHGRHSAWIMAITLSSQLLLATSSWAGDFTQADAKILQDAQSAVNEERFEQAVQSLLELQRKYPSEGEVSRLLTHAYFGQQKFADARRMAIRAVGLGRVTQDVLVRLAQIDEEGDDQTALINTIRLLTVIDADDRDWRVLYADLLVRAESLNEAAAVLRRLVRAEPESAVLQLRLGEVLVKQRKWDAAAIALTIAYYLGANHDRLPLLLAGVWQKLDDDHEAQIWIARAIDQSSLPSPTLSLQSAQLLWQLGEAERAAEVVQPLTESAEQQFRVQAHLLLGHIQNAAGQSAAAVAHWQNAIKDGADSVEVLALLGAHYFNAGEYGQAAIALKRVVDVERADHEQHLRYLIISLIKSKAGREADEFLVRYIERHGLNGQANKLVRLLAENRQVNKKN